MPQVVSDMVDAYIVRRINARTQFLLLLRRPDVALGNTWQSVHTAVDPTETAVAAAKRAILDVTGLQTVETYAADYINQTYDHGRDRIVLSPVFAFTVAQRAAVQLGDDYCDSAWCERDEAAARLLWSGQRWAVRHIDDVIGMGGPEAEFYRIEPPAETREGT